jgi:hypothetical protein
VAQDWLPDQCARALAKSQKSEEKEKGRDRNLNNVDAAAVKA